MCGRYYVDDDTAKEIERLVAEADKNIKENGCRDIHPADRATVIIDNNLQLGAKQMQWGFPQYQKKGLIINARSETVLERKMFRDSVLHRRCIIPAKHYYEWDADKNKVMFFQENIPCLYMAGFYNYFQEENRFVILTTNANESVRKVHDRMPLILEKREIEDWIYDDRFLEYALNKTPEKLQKFQEYEQQRLF